MNTPKMGQVVRSSSRSDGVPEPAVRSHKRRNVSGSEEMRATGGSVAAIGTYDDAQATKGGGSGAEDLFMSAAAGSPAKAEFSGAQGLSDLASADWATLLKGVEAGTAVRKQVGYADSPDMFGHKARATSPQVAGDDFESPEVPLEVYHLDEGVIDISSARLDVEGIDLVIPECVLQRGQEVLELGSTDKRTLGRLIRIDKREYGLKHSWVWALSDDGKKLTPFCLLNTADESELAKYGLDSTLFPERSKADGASSGRFLGAGGLGIVKFALGPKGLCVVKKNAKETQERQAKEARIQSLLGREITLEVLGSADTYDKDGSPIRMNFMELGQGKNGVRCLDDVLVSKERRIEFFGKVMELMCRMHAKGVAHHDLKLENAIAAVVDGKLWVRLIDFGHSVEGEGASGEIVSTNDMGSDEDDEPFDFPGYFAPECWGYVRTAGSYDARKSDVWHLGCILLELAADFQKGIKQNPMSEVSFSSAQFSTQGKAAMGRYQNKIDEILACYRFHRVEAETLIRHMLRVDPAERASVDEVVGQWASVKTVLGSKSSPG